MYHNVHCSSIYNSQDMEAINKHFLSLIPKHSSNPFNYKTIKHCSSLPPSDTGREKRCPLKFSLLLQESTSTVHIKESISWHWSQYIINMQESGFKSNFANLTMWQHWDHSYSFSLPFPCFSYLYCSAFFSLLSPSLFFNCPDKITTGLIFQL